MNMKCCPVCQLDRYFQNLFPSSVSDRTMGSNQGDGKYIGREMICVAFDIGTTNSAVSYAYLYPNDDTRVRMVTKWPGQPESLGSSKIPTLLAYRDGKYKACGAEALDYVDDDQYDIAKWFKLHLHPASMNTSGQPPPYGSLHNGLEATPIPPFVTIHKVYTDLMRYLMLNTRVSFEQNIPNGAAIWRRLRSTMVVILTTPNGWDFTQQSVLRKAAIDADVVSEEKAYDLLDFVTEGEASVHYVLAYSQSRSWLTTNSVFAVIDAGGSTIDSTLYECKSTYPRVVLEEACPSECVQAGGVFVDRAAEAVFKQKLNGSKFGEEDYIVDMVSAFESRTKRLFDGIQANYTVDFGGTRDNDRQHGILRGKLSLTNAEVASTFEDVVQRTVNSCLSLLSRHKAKHILLVGGLGESLYLQKKLAELFGIYGTTIVTVEEQTKKAAAEGAIIWYIKQSVTARIARVTLGLPIRRLYDPKDPEHRARESSVIVYPDGAKCLLLFYALVVKGTKIKNDFAVVRPSWITLNETLQHTGFDLIAWDGDGTPRWMNDANGNDHPQIRKLCRLNVNLSDLRNSSKPYNGPKGKYYRVEFKVVISLGATQLQAKLQWEENGIVREGPISILPNLLI